METNPLKVTEHFCRREFLNQEFCYTDGTIFSEIELWHYEDRVDIGVTFRIRDCERVAEIAFALRQGDQDYLENALHKANVMINHLQAFKEALISAQTLADNQKTEEQYDQRTSCSHLPG